MSGALTHFPVVKKTWRWLTAAQLVLVKRCYGVSSCWTGTTTSIEHQNRKHLTSSFIAQWNSAFIVEKWFDALTYMISNKHRCWYGAFKLRPSLLFSEEKNLIQTCNLQSLILTGSDESFIPQLERNISKDVVCVSTLACVSGNVHVLRLNKHCSLQIMPGSEMLHYSVMRLLLSCSRPGRSRSVSACVSSLAN